MTIFLTIIENELGLILIGLILSLLIFLYMGWDVWSEDKRIKKSREDAQYLRSIQKQDSGKSTLNA